MTWCVQDPQSPMDTEARYHCPAHAQDFLQAMGTDAPACRMVMPPDVPVVQAFIDNGRWTPAEAETARLRVTTLFTLCDWVSITAFDDEQDRQALLAALQAALVTLLEVLALSFSAVLVCVLG